MSMTAYDYYQS